VLLCFVFIDFFLLPDFFFEFDLAIANFTVLVSPSDPPTLRSWFITALLTDLIIDFGGGVGVALLRLDFFFFCNAAPLLIGWAPRCSFKDFLLSLLLVFLEACG
jgi:hypothetical protein